MKILNEIRERPHIFWFWGFLFALLGLTFDWPLAMLAGAVILGLTVWAELENSKQIDWDLGLEEDSDANGSPQRK